MGKARYDDAAESTLLITNSVRTLVPATTMARSPKPFIEAEIASVKANLLYAEKLQLNSYLFDILAMNRGDLRQARMPLRAMMRACSFLTNADDEVLREYGAVKTKKTKKRLKEYRQVLQNGDVTAMLDFLTAHGDDFAEGFKLFDAIAQFAEQVEKGFDAFAGLERSGVIKLQGWSAEPPGFDEHEQDYVNRAGWDLLDLIESGKRTVALDAGAAGGLLPGKAHGRLAEIQIANQVLNQLPGFSRASLDEIVDIRAELRIPIRRFRHEMAELADSVDPQLAKADFDLLWDRKIQPALDEIDELTEENKYLRRLADAVAEPKTLLASGGLLTLGFAGLSGIAQIVSATAGLAALPLDAAKKTRQGRKDLTKKRFYFVWRMK